MDGRYIENAGAIFLYVHGWTVYRKCRSNFLVCPWMDGISAMQEQLPKMVTLIWQQDYNGKYIRSKLTKA
jgi:hypothetical protein